MFDTTESPPGDFPLPTAAVVSKEIEIAVALSSGDKWLHAAVRYVDVMWSVLERDFKNGSGTIDYAALGRAAPLEKFAEIVRTSPQDATTEKALAYLRDLDQCPAALIHFSERTVGHHGYLTHLVAAAVRRIYWGRTSDQTVAEQRGTIAI